MKKLISVLLLACICVSLMAACGNHQSTDNPGNTDSTTEPNQETTQDTTGDPTQNTTQGGSSSGSGPDFEINFDDLLPKN